MEPTRGEKWALAARRQAKAVPVALDLVFSGFFFFIPTSWSVPRLLDGRLPVWDFAFVELMGVAFAVVAALWMFERRCLARLLDAKDQEIQQLKGQRDRA